jgi:prephenate dehydratase
MKVAFAGEPGAYGEEAALSAPGATEVVPCPSFAAVFSAVERGIASAGVVPVENSIAGPVSEVQQLLQSSPLIAVARVELRIRHCLLAPRGVSLASIRRVESHPQALAQCARFIASHGWESSPTDNTASGAHRLAQLRTPGTAAIASRRAADLYGLLVLAEDIADHPANTTSFVVVAERGGGRSG